MAGDEWFPGTNGDEDQRAFLTELRAYAEDRGLVDATPGDTTLHIWGKALVALVRVPGLQETPAQPTLEVVLHTGRGPDLWSGWETFGRLIDGYSPMDLEGVDLTPRGLAGHAFDWFHTQLHRPVEQLEWSTGARPPRVELRLRAPDELLVVPKSAWPFRMRRGRPDRTTRLR